MAFYFEGTLPLICPSHISYFIGYFFHRICLTLCVTLSYVMIVTFSASFVHAVTSPSWQWNKPAVTPSCSQAHTLIHSAEPHLEQHTFAPSPPCGCTKLMNCKEVIQTYQGNLGVPYRIKKIHWNKFSLSKQYTKPDLSNGEILKKYF